ncbi:MAG TPA: extracellular solute-binding protein [Clostridiales bacterium]|nr:extracellular solute-binding protein [Clostridiales bacterium]
MSTRSKWISLILAGAICATSLAGCSGGGAAGSSGSKDASNSTSSTASQRNFHNEGMPIVDQPLTLKVLTTRWGSMGDSFTKNQWLVDLEKNSNVKIEWQVQSLNDWSEQKSIMLASGQLPDVIFGDQTFSSEDIVNNLDFFLQLDDLIDQYMPNYKKAIEELPKLKQVSTFPDGKMYSMAKNLPARPTIRNQPIINKTWLDKLGLKVPTTIDELETVLKAFKDKDPNGNGKKDEIPIAGAVKGVETDLLNPFGITDAYDNGFILQDGKPVYYRATEAYKEGVKWLNKLYSEGLIDKESFTQDSTMLSAKQQDANAARVGFTYQWTPDAVFGKWSNQYMAIEPISGPDGKRYAGGDPDGYSSIMRNEVEIAKSCKTPEIAARWVDQFYTGEASIQNFWGAIGTVIQKNSDGTYELKNPPQGTSADAWYWDQSLRDFGPKYVSKDFQSKLKLSSNSGDGLKLEIAKLGEQYVTQPFPDVMHTSEEYSELPNLKTDIDKYAAKMFAQWVTKGGVDNDWNAYIQKLNDMGLQKYEQIQTDAYNRYLSVK